LAVQLILDRPIGLLIRAALVVLLPCLASGRVAGARAYDEARSVQPCVRSSQLLEMVNSLASSPSAADSYHAVLSLAFAGSSQRAETFAAFEESRYFVYALGRAAQGVVRRLAILKPSLFVIEDEAAPGSQDPMCFVAESSPSISHGEARVTEGRSEIIWEAPQPQQVSFKVSDGRPEATAEYIVRVSSLTASPLARSLYVFYVSDKVSANPEVHAKLIHNRDAYELSVPAGDRVLHLWLPSASAGAGEIEVSTTEGKTLVGRQPLPSGILPHGREGNRLLETWDADYRGSKPPAWDIGRPADELQRIVNDGLVHKCRAVDLCCGSGSDAVFLASRGFDVTAIDVAPTALAQARQKADRTGVTVQWLLADVLNPPTLRPFDFIYDRGCYHVVRDQNLAAYLETVRRLSHPGTQFLLLSARREEQETNSPGVTEEELRYDFSPLFSVDWLRAIRLESNEPGVAPPSWSALMRRNATP
jgi:methyl halide transferase